jgi:fructose-1,6-bisphosphatase/inositol monophosphatase family enzyme
VPDRARAELGSLYRIALAVHRAVREAAGSPHRADVVAIGASGNPTEELDRIAETEILRTLEAEGLDWNVVSEEAGELARGGDRTLVVDPIDGTSNALRHLPFFTVSLALGHRDLAGVDLGLVRDLDRGATYWAVRGQGAFCDGRPIRVRPRRPGAELLVANLGATATERAGRLAASARRVRAIGSASFEMTMVAQGAADAYLFENREPARNLRATDIAAAYRIVLEAGGSVTSARGSSLDGFPLGVSERTSVLAFADAGYGRELAEGGGP